MTASSTTQHTNPHLPTLNRLVEELDGSYPGCSLLDIVTEINWDRAKIQKIEHAGHVGYEIAAESLSLGAEVTILGARNPVKANKSLPSSIHLKIYIQESYSYRLKIFCSMAAPSFYTYSHANLELYRLGREVSFPLAGYPHSLRLEGWLGNTRWADTDIPGSPPEYILRGHSNLGGAVASALLYVGLSLDWQRGEILRPTVEKFRQILAQRTREPTTV